MRNRFIGARVAFLCTANGIKCFSKSLLEVTIQEIGIRIRELG